MLFRDVVDLVTYQEQDDGLGGIVKVPVQRQVFANKKSVRQSEFYQAHMAGLNPELMFEVRSIEYDDEKELSYNDKLYTIIRTYSKNDEITELICTRVVT